MPLNPNNKQQSLRVDAQGRLLVAGSGGGGGSPANLTIGTRTATTVPINNSNGTGVTLPVATGSLAGTMSAADKTKLDGLTAPVYRGTWAGRPDPVTSGAGATIVITDVGVSMLRMISDGVAWRANGEQILTRWSTTLTNQASLVNFGTIDIPGGLVAPNSRLRVHHYREYPSNTDTKQYQTNFGAGLTVTAIRNAAGPTRDNLYLDLVARVGTAHEFMVLGNSQTTAPFSGTLDLTTDWTFSSKGLYATGAITERGCLSIL